MLHKLTEEEAELPTLPGIAVAAVGPEQARRVTHALAELTAQAAAGETPVHRCIDDAYQLGWRCAERRFAAFLAPLRASLEAMSRELQVTDTEPPSAPVSGTAR
jgi:hypothetical protein